MSPQIDRQEPLAVLGAGSWGTALAILLAKNGNEVRLWGRDADKIDCLQKERHNLYYLPNCPFPDNLVIENELSACLAGIRDIVIAVPSNAFSQIITDIKADCEQNPGKSVRILIATKGLDPDTGKLLHQVVLDTLGSTTPVAVLSGPTFAKEVAMLQPTAVSLTGNNTDFVRDLIVRLHNNYFRIYENPDLIGVQICGILKNIFAIAIGMAEGMQLGANARSALITRALAEMGRFNLAMGGNPHTLNSLAGVGDLVLTCTENQSRNRRFGVAIGQGKTIDEAKTEIGQAIEGLINVYRVFELAKQLHVEMPIVTQVHRILLTNCSPKQAVESLLARELKREFE